MPYSGFSSAIAMLLFKPVIDANRCVALFLMLRCVLFSQLSMFKGKLALELVKELRTLNEIATEYGVHPSVIAKWKKQLLEGIPLIFSKEIQENNKAEEYEELIAMLYQKIGQLEVELEWFKKKSVIVTNRKKGSYRVGIS